MAADGRAREPGRRSPRQLRDHEVRIDLVELSDEAHARLAPSQTCVRAPSPMPTRRRVDSRAAASTAPRRCGVASTPSLRPSRRVDSHVITTTKTPSTQLEVQTDSAKTHEFKPRSPQQSSFQIRRFRLVAVAPRTLQPQSSNLPNLIFGPLEALAPVATARFKQRVARLRIVERGADLGS